MATPAGPELDQALDLPETTTTANGWKSFARSTARGGRDGDP
jgi:hypothetical protein